MQHVLSSAPASCHWQACSGVWLTFSSLWNHEWSHYPGVLHEVSGEGKGMWPALPFPCCAPDIQLERSQYSMWCQTKGKVLFSAIWYYGFQRLLRDLDTQFPWILIGHLYLMGTFENLIVNNGLNCLAEVVFWLRQSTQMLHFEMPFRQEVALLYNRSIRGK